MRSIRFSGPLLALGCTLTAAVAAIGAEPQLSEAWRTVTDDRLAHPEAGDWASYRRTNDVTAFSPLDQITAGNVSQLRPIWSFTMRDSGRWAATPLVVNGMMYVAEGSGRLTAFDAATGDVVWVHDRSFPKDISISQAYGRARGVAVYGNLIIWGTADSYLLALDARTGKIVWEVKTGDYHSGEGHNHPPLVVDGRIFIGHSGGDRTARGKFRAYDASTGKLLWTIYTAPRPGDPGYETWKGSILQPMGAAPWNTVSYDPELKLVYFGTGQPTPWIEGQRGTGLALFSNSIVAADAETGKIRWHFQVTPYDNWDRDSVFENMLVDLTINGRVRKALVQTGKSGWGVIVDRQTGKFISSFPTAYETVIKGYSRDGKPIMNPELSTKASDVGTAKVWTVCPHLHGARNLNAASFSPITKLYYVGINNTCMTTTVRKLDFEEGQPVGSTSGKAIRVPGYDYVGEFVAFDPATGKRAWAYRPPGGAAMTASALSTAGGLVFGGTVDRQFFALRADTGQLLWQNRLGGDISGAPISFAVGGRQYIAVTSGGRPGPTTSFAPLTNTYLSAGTGSVTVFALPDERDLAPYPRAGKATAIVRSQTPDQAAVSPVSTPAEVGTTAENGPTLFTAAQVARGQEVFKQSCAACHKISDQSGVAFHARWGNGTAAALFNFVSGAMPENAPGSLPKGDYAAVMAYMMRESGFQAGPTELPADSDALEKIKLRQPTRRDANSD
ncbi:PQQ-binding-like beta-propeller repeat protein [Sphingobium sp. H39-3-25]|uniref:outer membrane protein assembly factor BamB family protein n=1 Tax=Sphingobium arseniciresistens TaxID=3030834 RepID=UPI0023B90FC3|nr:PQQ-binding-like beta-propeller repeat protein [Sphingobium arseniciresistens]